MVSLLWKACSQGDLESVQKLLNDATSIDIEIKDHTGVTPLIEAIKNGHGEIVRALLDRGADPMNGSSEGRPEQYTSDPFILELLSHAQAKSSNTVQSQEPVYTHPASDVSDMSYPHGHPPPLSYTFYPSLNSAPPPPESGVYFPQPPPPQAAPGNHTSGGVGNLPPPEIARFIPCRYFPACRYGASCLFAHPQTQYFQGPIPAPNQYVAPYDPMNVPSYPQNYYAPPPFQPSNPAHMTPLSPPPSSHMSHGRSPSEVVLPVHVPFNPNSAPPALPYGPVSPSAYPPPGQPSIPIPVSPLPLLPPQTLPPQSSSNMYNSTPVPAPPFIQHDTTLQYSAPQPTPANTSHQNTNSDVKPPSNPQSDATGPITHHRDGTGHHRRGAARRGSFGGRKPPCLFFPSGRCKNGGDCRFPHVLPDGSATHHPPYAGRAGARSRQPNSNGFVTINEKLAGMNVGDDSTPQNGSDEPNYPHLTDHGRPRFPPSAKNNHQQNGLRSDKKSGIKQRVPNPDEFPVLSGSNTPSSRSPGTNGILSNGNVHGGPTAAQVLQAPPPTRKDSSKESSTRGTTPDSTKHPTTTTESNGAMSPPPAHDHPTAKLPVSFAAVAAPDVPKEITLAA